MATTMQVQLGDSIMEAVVDDRRTGKLQYTRIMRATEHSEDFSPLFEKRLDRAYQAWFDGEYLEAHRNLTAIGF